VWAVRLLDVVVFVWILQAVLWMLSGMGLWAGAGQPQAWWATIVQTLLSPYDVLTSILTASATALLGVGFVLVLSERGFIGLYGLMLFASLVFALTLLGPAIGMVVNVGSFASQLLGAVVGVSLPQQFEWSLNALVLLLTVIALLDLWRGQRTRDLGV
jgi:hypothetical protein